MLDTSRGRSVQIKNEANLVAMRRAGRVASECLAWILQQVEPGVTTLDIDDLQMQFVREHGVKPAPLGYKGFPRSLCTSVNEVICHGIPSRKLTLRSGDIIGIDVTLIVEGFHGDTAATIAVGEVDEQVAGLLRATLEAQRRGVEAVQPDARIGNIGHAIQSVVESQGFSVVRDFVGHGIGRGFHEEPQVPHYGRSGRGLRLRPGMTFTIEPMVNAGKRQVKVLKDGWTVVTKDRSLSAQWEHTLLVTDDGYEVLTLRPGDDL